MKKKQHKKYQSVITARLQQSMRKATATCLVLFMFTLLLQVGGTNAGFSDTEESNGNVFTATSLDGRISYLEQFLVTGMTPEDNPNQNMTFRNDGSLDFQYEIKYRKISGDDALCNALLLTAKNGVTTVYDKLPLKDFDSANIAGNPFILPVFGQDNWNFALELPADAGSALENKNCSWNFDLHAWQTNLPDNGTGFVDVETAGIHSVTTGEWLTSGDVVINEVMWMGSDGETSDEWIELKNMTGQDIDLSNWNIKQGGTGSGVGAHIEIPHGYSIKGNGYFLVTKKKWNETAVALASDLSDDEGYTHVAGMSLHNDGEQLVLEDKDEQVIDSTPLGAWPAGSNGALKQSMERNNIPGDGTLASNWHTCVSGNCNDGTYWDTVDGNNFGTPRAANLSPIVMNEFVMNPAGDDDAERPEGEWIELYNILTTDIDVAGWYFTNATGDQIAVTADNTASGTTVVPGRGTLVVYLEQTFLDNDADTLSLYAPGVLPEDVSDDVREDTFSYTDAHVLPEGKSYARFPDGEGIWLDPEATPGEENVMAEAEVQIFRRLTYDLCFEDEQLKKDTNETMCSPIFLTYIGMLDAVDDHRIVDSVLLDILDMIRLEEEEKLVALLGEDGVLTPEELALVPGEEETEEDVTTPAVVEEENSEKTPRVEAREEDAVPPTAEPAPIDPLPSETVPEVMPEGVPVPEEAVTEPEAVPVVEEKPAVVAEPVAKVEEPPVEVPVEATIPVN